MNLVVNFSSNFVGKLRSSLREKLVPFGEIVSEYSIDVVHVVTLIKPGSHFCDKHSTSEISI